MYRNSLKAIRATCSHGFPSTQCSAVSKKSGALRLRDVWMVQPRHSSPSAWSPIRDLMHTEKTGGRTPETSGRLGEKHGWNWLKSRATKRPCCYWSAAIDPPRCEHPTWVHLVKTDPVRDDKGSDHGNLSLNLRILKTLNLFRASERCSCYCLLLHSLLASKLKGRSKNIKTIVWPHGLVSHLRRWITFRTQDMGFALGFWFLTVWEVWGISLISNELAGIEHSKQETVHMSLVKQQKFQESVMWSRDRHLDDIMAEEKWI